MAHLAWPDHDVSALHPVQTAAPAAAILSTADAKAHSWIEDSADDSYVDALVGVATRIIEERQRRKLITQTWAQSFDGFCSVMRLPFAPVQSVSSITYWDDDNASQTAATSLYALHEDAVGPFVALLYDQTWPTTYSREDAVTVTFVAGYGDAATDVPANILHAAKMLVAHLYDNRHAVSMNDPEVLPWGVGTMIELDRRFG